VEESAAWIVGDEVEPELPEATKHHHVLQYSGRRLAAGAHELVAMPM
jgi:hypothetical protein